jgi:hypothetical protein
MADHFVSAKPDEDVFSKEAAARLASITEENDEQLRVFFVRLRKIRDSDRSMFSLVKSEIAQYSSSSEKT